MKNLRITTGIFAGTVSLLCLGAGFGYAAFYRSLVRDSRFLALQTTVAQEEMSAESNRILLRKTVSNVQKKEDELARLFVAEDAVVDLFQSIETFGDRVGITVEIASVAEEAISGKTDDSLKFLKLHITARGKWKGIFRFLLFLESLPFAVHIEDVQLKQAGTSAREDSFWNGFFNITVMTHT